MPDRWGRPTFNDGFNVMRGAMAIQTMGQRQKIFNDRDTADKYFGMKLKGEEVPQGEDYNARADLAADEMVNRKWQSGQIKRIADTEEKLATMTDEDALKFQPTNYAEHIVASHRIKMIGSNEQNRQAIDDLNKKKAMEAYQYSTAAFNEARDKYAKGDFKGASDELVKIGMITNNPFKVKPSEDGKTVELYFTKDGVDQPGQKLPIDQAMQVAQEHLVGEDFFKAHLQNREARKSLNEKSLLNPILFEKGKERLRAVRELDLNTNQVRWSVYDKNGDLHGGKPIQDLGALYKEGWEPYNAKTVDAALKREKLVTGIEKDRAQTAKAVADTEGSGAPKKWSKEWWPQTPSEKEGGDTPITEARAIVAKAYDTSNKQTKKLLSGQILPEYKRWVDQNKDQMVQGEDGQERPLNSQDLQNAFDHISYNIIQKATAKPKAKAVAGPELKASHETNTRTKVESREPQTKQGKSGMVEPGNIDLENRPVVKNQDGSKSTELSFSIGTDKGEVLLPQIINGKKVSKQEAIDHYKNTGEHLGIFKDAKTATKYAESLHNRREKETFYKINSR
jgi:hypothetical protein